MDKLTVGMIGVANFGAFRRKQMRASGHFTLAAVCDRNAESLAAAVTEEQSAAYTDFAAMLAHPGLEGVVISTGADSHASLAIAAMRKGLHVFVEKPLCCFVAEVDALRQAARETGRVIGLGHNHCVSDPLLNLAKRFIQGLIDGASAILAAGTEICNNYANVPCKVTNVLLYYGFPEDIGSEIEVRPVWAVEFYLGKAIVYVDAATGTVLDTTVSEEN